MGWKGTLRSVNATLRALEREERQRQKQLARDQREYEKMHELAQAQYEVEVHENYLDRLISIHKEQVPPIDWQALAAADPPQRPDPTVIQEELAREQLENYKPGLMDRLLKREAKIRTSLQEALNVAVENDRRNLNELLADFEVRHQSWREDQAIAIRILNGEAEAFLEAIAGLDPFQEIQEYSGEISYRSDSDGTVHVQVQMHGSQVVPNEAKSLLKSGRLSIKAMPKGRFNELYQDYVCSVLFRMAGDLFAILPLKAVIVTALDEMLDRATGHLANRPIVSAFMPRTTFERLNLAFIDPSDAMANFIHNMDFKKTRGFGPVIEITRSITP